MLAILADAYANRISLCPAQIPNQMCGVRKLRACLVLAQDNVAFRFRFNVVVRPPNSNPNSLMF